MLQQFPLKTKVFEKNLLYGLFLIGIIIFAALLRLALIALGWPPTDSDEGTMGLAALHIAYRGELPVFFYGQSYMGTLEAYIGALFFRLFGVSVFALRLSSLLLFIFFLIAMYLLARLLYTKRVALLSLILLSLGTGEMLYRQVETAGGYIEILFFGAVLFLLASWLSLSLAQDVSKRKQMWRLLAYGGWGLAAGLGLWSDYLVLPFIVTSGLLLLIFCWFELRKLGLLCIFLGFVIGALPLISYYLTAPAGQNFFSVLLQLAYGSGQGTIQTLFGQEIAGTVLVSLPYVTGVGALCSLSPRDAWPLSAQSSAHSIQCTTIHGIWGVSFIVLWLIVVFAAITYLWKMWRQYSEHWWAPAAKLTSIRSFAHLMILGSAGLTFMIYVLSPIAALTPWPSTRYLMGLLIATPAMLAPLLDTRNRVTFPLKFPAKLVLFFKSAVLLFFGVILLLGTITLLDHARTLHNQQQDALSHHLLDAGITHIYSDYWTCDRIIFQSNEQIICSVLNEHLQPGQDRYLPYRSMVNQYPHPSYVFPLPSPQADAVLQQGILTSSCYQRLLFDNYVVYQPLRGALSTACASLLPRQ